MLFRAKGVGAALILERNGTGDILVTYAVSLLYRLAKDQHNYQTFLHEVVFYCIIIQSAPPMIKV